MVQKSFRSVRPSVAVGCALLICVLTLNGVAQSKQLPRIGTIKDYPATGLMTGCGNLYFYPANRADTSSEAYVFLARGDGSNAWMNLAGRDVRLQQIKNRQPRQYFYRWGNLRISVVIENFKPASAPVVEGDSMFKMKITLRRGRTVRIVRAVGDTDC